MTKNSSLYVLILAGGSGERFWPLSRRHRPKQLLSLFSAATLLEETLARLEGLVPPDHVLILTNREQEAAVRELAPGLPPENIVAEPAKRDTAAAIALGAGWVSMRDPSATMIVLPADHLIKDREAFQATLLTAAAAARETGSLVTVGIKPTWACPGFGYIESGEPKAVAGATQPVLKVARFREKPNPELAEQFLRQGGFWWNAGMFVWTLPAILGELSRHAAPLAQFVEHLHTCGDFEATLAARFPELPKISIDYAIMEKADRVLMVEAGFDWDDVGSWTAVAKYLQQDGSRNSVNAADRLSAHNASGNIVYSTQPGHIALMGVRDLIVVQTGDALLIAHRDDAEKIKNLVAQVPPALQ